MCPYAQIQNNSQYSHTLLTTSTEMKSHSPIASLFIENANSGHANIHLQIWTCKHWGWCPSTLQTLCLHSDSALESCPCFQGLIMIPSCWGTGLLLLSVWLLQVTTCLSAQAEGLVLNQNFPLYSCTVTMRTFHPKLISYSSYWTEAAERQSGERFCAFPFTESSHSGYCVRFHLVLILYENSFLGPP